MTAGRNHEAEGTAEQEKDLRRNYKFSQIALEDGLAVGGFVAFVGGLSILFSLAVALAVGGFILFGLGVGLAIYKGTR